MKPGSLLAAKYRLEYVLGAGAMGKVWAAVNESTGRPVAIKMTHSAAPDLRIRMLREARAVGTLKHKNIVDLYDAGETEKGDPYLVMERLSGETLTERLERDGRFPPARAIEIATAIASALKVAHAHGIVHRDLKPDNVFLHREVEGEGEIVKVLDFGVSKHLNKEVGGTITGGPVGSPPYMSPEQVAEGKVDARSDLWSLGIVLFEMLSGRRPFTASSPYLVLSDVVRAPIPSIADMVPGLSPTLVHVVQRCLTRELDARVGSADELIQMLARAAEVDPGEEDPTTKLEQMSQLDEPTTEELEDVPARGAPAPATSAPGDRPVSGPVRTRRASNAVVALFVVAGATAFLLIVLFTVIMRRAHATVEAATAATDAKQPREATNIVVRSIPQPTVAAVAPAGAPEVAPARSEPATPPRKNETQTEAEAPAAAGVSSVVEPIGTASPRKAAARPHPGGDKRLVLP